MDRVSYITGDIISVVGVIQLRWELRCCWAKTWVVSIVSLWAIPGAVAVGLVQKEVRIEKLAMKTKIFLVTPAYSNR